MKDFLEDISIPALDKTARENVCVQWRTMDTMKNSLGRLEDMVADYAAMTGGNPTVAHKAMILAAADHGVARQGVSNFPQEVTVQMVNGYLRGGAGANIMAAHAGIKYEDIFILDVGVQEDMPAHPSLVNKKIAYGTQDFTWGPAMTREEAIRSVREGFELSNKCIDAGYGLLLPSEMGIGNTTSSAAIAAVFTGLPAEKTVGRGTGIGDERLLRKQAIVAKALEINRPDKRDALDVLAKVGGFELGALAGVFIAGASRRVPVFVDGINATAAALIAWGLFPSSREYMFASHLSAEIAHPAMLELLSLQPVLTANMRLGEGTGASLVIALLDAAIKVFNKED